MRLETLIRNPIAYSESNTLKAMKDQPAGNSMSDKM